MDTTKWWYAQDQERFGPIDQEELKALLDSGKLPRETPVWCEGMEDWTVAERAGLVPPLPPKLIKITGAPTPTRRFWARVIDMGLFIFSPLYLLVWIPIEALLLSTWGYTPGKWLLGVKVVDQSGKKMSFDIGIHRAFLVWLKGLCLGISICWLFSFPIAYRKLKKEGKTTWDKDLNIRVEQELVPTGRKIFLVILIALYLFLGASLVTLVM